MCFGVNVNGNVYLDENAAPLNLRRFSAQKNNRLIVSSCQSARERKPVRCAGGSVQIYLVTCVLKTPLCLLIDHFICAEDFQQ